MGTSLFNHPTTSQDLVDAKTQPETAIRREGCGCKHVVASELPHACQQLDQSTKEQGKSDCDVDVGCFGPFGVGSLQSMFAAESIAPRMHNVEAVPGRAAICTDASCMEYL